MFLRFAFLTLLMIMPSWLLSQVLINETCSSNISGLADEDGDYIDWIELFNNSPAEVSLAGYQLSDDAKALDKWTFPALKMRPWSYLLVYASGKDRRDIPVTYKTIIPRAAEWQYLVPSSEPQSSWKSPGYDASKWKQGDSGFGFGDNDDSTVISNTVSVYIRKEFSVADPSGIDELVLSIDYDDGFIAWVNGHEIARSNVGTAASVPYSQVASASREAQMYSGGFPENYIIRNPGSFLVEGINVIAIQGHNAGSTSGDLSLIPMLSTGRYTSGTNDSVPKYISLAGRKLHSNFRIESDGESLYLSLPGSSVSDSVSPVRMTANISYGRKGDGEKSWFYFASPTPLAPNLGRAFSSLNCDTVIFSAGGGYYPGGLMLALSSVRQSDSIFYTLNGSEPGCSSSFYKGPFQVNGNSVVRAISVKAGQLPGPVSTNTYITKQHTLPVVCLSTDSANLWDYNTGIYVMGPNASTTSPYFGANFWQDWERKAHVELYDTKGIKQLDQDIGIKIYGAYSRARPQKSLALYARKEYGKGSFEYKVFSDKPIYKFESIVLRNSGNDWGLSFMRDGLTGTLVRDMDIDAQAYQPAIVYLNGAYWGIMDLREKISSNYIAGNHFVDPDNVNLLVSNASVLEGSNASYTQLTTFLNGNTLESEQKYRQVAGVIDVNNFIQYQLTQVYIDNRDWPGNNIKFWNTNDEGSLWRWILYDTDFGFGYKGASAYTYNTLEWALAPDSQTGANRPWATLLFRRMLSYKGFRDEFANQYADRINRNFSAERVTNVIDSIKAIYMPEMGDHQKRWNLSYDKWLSNCSVVSNFALNRPDNARAHLRTILNLGEPLQVKVDINEPGLGKVKVNSIFPYEYPFTGTYFKDLPIRLTAIPEPGYRFVKWEMGPVSSQSVTLDYNMASPGNFRAVFSLARPTDIKIVINEISYKSPESKDSKDWIELYNAGKSTVNLKGWALSDGAAEEGFVFAENYNLPPGAYVIVCRDLEAFRSIFPRATNSTGNFAFGLSSSGDEVNLYDPDGNLVDFVEFETDSPWPEDVYEKGGSIELTDAFADNNSGKYWKANLPGGTPGCLNLQAMRADDETAVISEGRISCYPNPFSDYTTIRLEVPLSGRYRLEVYDLQGRKISTISDQEIEAGEYYVDWYGDDSNGVPVQNGIYIINLTGEGLHYRTRVMVMR